MGLAGIVAGEAFVAAKMNYDDTTKSVIRRWTQINADEHGVGHEGAREDTKRKRQPNALFFYGSL